MERQRNRFEESVGEVEGLGLVNVIELREKTLVKESEGEAVVGKEMVEEKEKAVARAKRVQREKGVFGEKERVIEREGV